MNYRRVLSIQDISCLGQCSLTVALPILSACGVEVCPLPTALLSTHTGGLGTPHIRDLTADMEAVANHWKGAGMSFDLISTGYLGSISQMEIVASLIHTLAAPGCVTVIDPAMADHGTLYAGFDRAFVDAMRQFCGGADYLLPNLTEACLLTGMEYRERYDRAYLEDVLARLAALGCGSVVLTGVSLEGDTTGVMVYRDGKQFYYGHRRLARSCHGTGDIFAAAFSGALMRGKTAERAARIAAEFTLSCMELTLAENTRPYGVMFEPKLGELISMLEEET